MLLSVAVIFYVHGPGADQLEANRRSGAPLGWKRIAAAMAGICDVTSHYTTSHHIISHHMTHLVVKVVAGEVEVEQLHVAGHLVVRVNLLRNQRALHHHLPASGEKSQPATGTRPSVY